MSNRAWGHGRVRTAVAALVVALSVVTLTACTPDPPPDDADALPRDTTTATPTPTPDVTPTPVPPGTIAALPDGVKPERPAELDGPPSLGAAEMIAPYYLQLMAYARNTNDITELEALSHPDCVFCGSVLSRVRDLASIGGHAVGGGVSISEVTGLAVDPRNWFSMNLVMQESPSQNLDKNNVVIKDYPASPTYDIEIIVVHQDGRWLVREVSYERRNA